MGRGELLSLMEYARTVLADCPGVWVTIDDYLSPPAVVVVFGVGLQDESAIIIPTRERAARLADVLRALRTGEGE